MQTILRVKNVTKHYGGGSVVTKALDGISLDICEKEFVAVMGASGSGKSCHKIRVANLFCLKLLTL